MGKQKKKSRSTTENDIPSIDCSSPKSNNEIYIPECWQSGYRPSLCYTSPPVTENVEELFKKAGVKPWHLDDSYSPDAKLVEHSSDNKLKRKRAKFELRNQYFNDFEAVTIEQTETEKIRKPKKQKFLFEDTPISQARPRLYPLPLEEVEPVEKSKKHKKNGNNHSEYRSCIDVDTPSTSRGLPEENSYKKKKRREQNIQFEILPSDSLLDDTDTSNDEVSEYPEERAEKKKREKSAEYRSAFHDTPSTSKVPDFTWDYKQKKKKNKLLFDDSQTAVPCTDTQANEETPITKDKSRSEKRTRAKSECSPSLPLSMDTLQRSRVADEDHLLLGNRPKKKVPFEAHQQSTTSQSRLEGCQANLHQQPNLRQIQQHRLENDVRPIERLQRLEEVAKEDKRKKGVPFFPSLRTFVLNPKPPVENVEKEIRRLQKTTCLLIEKAPFKRLVKEITRETSGKEFRHGKDAVEALQEAAEAFLVELFGDTLKCAHANGRKTIDVNDIQLVRSLQKW